MILVVAAIFALVTLVAAEPTVVDLSVDFETSLDNPGSRAIQETAAAFPKIRTALVLEHGRIVAEYARNDVDPTVPYHIWSSTKSWISLLVGLMVESNLTTLDETLGDIWPPGDDVWGNITDAEVRQNVTIRALLTMSSGLVDPFGPGELLSLNFTDGGDAGGASLEGSLSFPNLGEPGVFSYLTVSNILSYIIQNKTGMAPREYAAEIVFPSLGIEDATIDWWRNQDGMEYAYHGLLLTARQMAKFGQLYLQEGLSAPDEQLISSEWVAQSSAPQVLASVVLPDTNITIPFKYGYLFWIVEGAQFGLPNTGSYYCAFGLGGQDICVHSELDRVAVQQREYEDQVGGGIIAGVAFDSSLSFSDGSPPSMPTPTVSPILPTASDAPSPGPAEGDTSSGVWGHAMWETHLGLLLVALLW